MSIKAGRVGVNPSQVNPVDGSILSSATSGYTKDEADAKFETQTNASTEYAKLQPKTLVVPISMLQGSVLVPKTTVEAVVQTMDKAMTNKELTELATVQESACTDIISDATVDSSVGNHILKTGNVVQLVLRLNNVTMANTFATMCKIPEGFRPKYSFNLRDALTTNGFAIQSNGNILNRDALSNATVVLCTTWITN